jgi:hypothetical protein
METAQVQERYDDGYRLATVEVRPVALAFGLAGMIHKTLWRVDRLSPPPALAIKHRWTVSERTTGKAIAYGRTLAEVTEKAGAMLAQQGPEKTAEAIKRSMDTHGAANEVTPCS